MTLTVRRLPGIRFERQAPPLEEVLPRMDVAGFVGFARSGPVDVPVPVEDAAQFAAIFGADAELARDAERGEDTSAFLGPAVRAFFRNGGRRCWVVRVAQREHAVSDLLPLPGIAAVDEEGRLEPAVLRARSDGSWADGLRVAASLEPAPVRLQAHSLAGLAFDAFLGSPGELVVGDLVRISFPRSPWTLYVGIASIDAYRGSPPWPSPVGEDDPELRRHVVQGGPAWWIRSRGLGVGRAGHLHYLGEHGPMHVVGATVVEPGPGAEGLVRFALEAGGPAPPEPGDVVRAVFSRNGYWLDVVEVDVAPDGTLAVVGAVLEATRRAPASEPVQAPGALAERLSLRLEVEDATGAATVLGGLGFLPAHPRFAGALPVDAELYGGPAPAERKGLYAAAAQPRFPAAGPETAPRQYLPLGASILEGPALPAIRPENLARYRDGLGSLEPGLFLDPGLATVERTRLLAEAFRIQYAQPQPRPLRGVHALLGIDEVTIVAAPDAVQRRWFLAPPLLIPHAGAPAPAEPPDWSRFLDCATHVPSAPVLAKTGDEETGVFALEWSPTDAEGATYELQETVDEAQAGDAATLYSGPERAFSVYGRPAGSTLYYRVRALAAGYASGWSNWVVVRTTQEATWELDDAPAYVPAETLLPVQRALLRMCAARGDLFAVLALPEHYRERAAIAHVQTLKTSAGLPPGSEPDPVFSYGALYHPWLYASEPADPTDIRRTPPDGAAAGVLAARATRRGAWVAPANEPLRDVLQLDPPPAAEWLQALQDAQVNAVRHEPEGFLWLAADTLSDDPDLRPIGVRRLLQVLRRAALLHGSVYAFEPNGPELRRSVERGFERLLGRMFELGAFAGARASDAYRVEVGSPPNTPQSVDAGRLIVELKVAPSRPLAFLTVRLVRTGEGSLHVEAR